MFRTGFQALLLFCGAIGIVAVCVAEDPNANLDREIKVLQQVGVEINAQAIQSHLSWYVPPKLTAATAEAKVQLLGSELYHEREAAYWDLARMPQLPPELLAAASRSRDAEIQWRARSLLQIAGKTDLTSMYAAIKYLSVHTHPETLLTLVQLAGCYTDEYHQHLFNAAIQRIVKQADVPKLLNYSPNNAGEKWALALALQNFDNATSTQLIIQLAETDETRIAFVAARYLGNQGDRRVLACLIRLCQSKNEYLAAESLNFFNALTGNQFVLRHGATNVEQQELAHQLQNWLKNSGDAAVLKFPVIESAIERGNLAGKTLIATAGLGQVIEMETNQKITWTYLIDAWSAEKLRNGNVLIASYVTNTVQEVDKYGETVWSKANINAMRAKPLPNQHTLIACFSNNAIVEWNAARDEIWRYETPDNCFDVERLSNGNTIFACPLQIGEVTLGKELVRTLKMEGRANSVQALSNGDWLIANYGNNKVEQYNRQDKLVWSCEIQQPSDAFRLANGNTLITTSGTCVEVNPKGESLHEFCPAKYGSCRK
jgi:hypothetical protein